MSPIVPAALAHPLSQRRACRTRPISCAGCRCTVAVGEDLLTAATRLLDAPALAAVHAQCQARVDDELDWAAEDPPRSQALRAARLRVVSGKLVE